jgi:GNAT superfamily N-acetyltransferase
MPSQRSARPALNLNGYTDLPPGKIATVVTYLEMRERPRLRRLTKPEGWRLERIAGDLDRYRALFRQVGEPWLWFSRLLIGDAALKTILNDPRVEAYALTDGNEDIGFVELDFRPANACELSYFGVVPEAVGTRAGRLLMNEAVRRAFKRPIRRFFVHTCSLDHPAALPFYMRSGFTPYKRAIEVADDPRLAGRLPLDAAPQVPVIGGTRR